MYGQAAPVADDAQAAAKPTIDAAKAADIRTLLELAGTRELIQESFGGSLTQIRPLVKNSLPAGDYREKLLDLFFAKFESKVDLNEFLNMAVPVYDKYFTHDELKQLIQFYQTPTGKKAISTLPKLTAELREIGQKWGEQIGRESMREVLMEHPDLAAAMEQARQPAAK